MILGALPAWGQEGFADRGTDVESFVLPDPARILTFPRDHGVHENFRLEWWYMTADLPRDFSSTAD